MNRPSIGPNTTFEDYLACASRPEYAEYRTWLDSSERQGQLAKERVRIDRQQRRWVRTMWVGFLIAAGAILAAVLHGGTGR